MMLIVAVVGLSYADAITLDNGTSLDGSLTHYELDGSCTIRLDSGPLLGADLVIPCGRISRFERETAPLAQAPVADEPIEEIVVTAPPTPTAPLPVEVATATAGTEPDEAPTASIEEEAPVAATSPEPSSNRMFGTLKPVTLPKFGK